MRLTPHQIGRLALHVEAALRQNPLPDGEAKQSKAGTGPEQWEVDLRNLVGRDFAIPYTYEELDSTPKFTMLIESLIAYLEP